MSDANQCGEEPGEHRVAECVEEVTEAGGLRPGAGQAVPQVFEAVED